MASVTRQISAIFRSSASRFASSAAAAGAADGAELDIAAAADDAELDSNDDEDDAAVDGGGGSAGRLAAEWIRGRFARNGDALPALASRGKKSGSSVPWSSCCRLAAYFPSADVISRRRDGWWSKRGA